jgi:hypothetical protein
MPRIFRGLGQDVVCNVLNRGNARQEDVEDELKSQPPIPEMTTWE